MDELYQNELLPGHDALVKLIIELGISSIVADEYDGVLISYHDSRIESQYIRRGKRPEWS